MSYTAPQYVDTKEQAILALASTIKGEAVTGGDGSVNRALDILADVLAEQDVQVPQTDAGAILALAQYVSGGGGGGGSVDVGEPVVVLLGDTPVVGNQLPGIFLFKGVSSDAGAQQPCSMSYGDSTFGMFTPAYGMVASGITVSNFKAQGEVIGFYDVTIDMNNGTYSAIAEITNSVDYSTESGNLLTFTVPAIEHDALIIATAK